MAGLLFPIQGINALDGLVCMLDLVCCRLCNGKLRILLGKQMKRCRAQSGSAKNDVKMFQDEVVLKNQINCAVDCANTFYKLQLIKVTLLTFVVSMPFDASSTFVLL